MIFYILGAFGPTVSAFIITYTEDGKLGVNQLWRKSINFRIKKIWFIPIFLLIPALFGMALMLDKLVGGVTPELTLLSSPLLIVGNFIFLFFLGGSCQEEFGWRGYALDKLQLKYNALWSSLILGFFWALWHLPLFFISGTGQSYMPFWLFFISTISLTILFTWLHNNSNGSLFIALLFHTVVNLSYSLFPLFEMKVGGRYDAFVYATILMTVTAIAVVIIWGPEKFTRKGSKGSSKLTENLKY